MSSKAASQPEAALHKLRRLPENMSCPNCSTPAPKGVGFGNVCIKFKTFVCDLCKTSHQAISHRVKSVSMSTWTHEEVAQLMEANGGGNAVALHVWLQNAPKFGGRYPGGSRPKPGDRIEVFKQFVLDCYEYGKFKSSEPYVPSLALSRSTSEESYSPTSESSVGGPTTATSSASRVVKTPNISAAPVAPAVDLLDLNGSDPFASSAHVSVGGNNANSGFSFIAPPPPPLQAPSNGGGGFDAFSGFSFIASSPTSPASSSASTDPFALPPTSSPSSTFVSSDPFATSGPQSSGSSIDLLSLTDPSSSSGSTQSHLTPAVDIFGSSGDVLTPISASSPSQQQFQRPAMNMGPAYGGPMGMQNMGSASMNAMGMNIGMNAGMAPMGGGMPMMMMPGPVGMARSPLGGPMGAPMVPMGMGMGMGMGMQMPMSVSPRQQQQQPMVAMMGGSGGFNTSMAISSMSTMVSGGGPNRPGGAAGGANSAPGHFDFVSAEIKTHLPAKGSQGPYGRPY